MKNILDIIKELGIEVPEDKTAELNKAAARNAVLSEIRGKGLIRGTILHW